MAADKESTVQPVSVALPPCSRSSQEIEGSQVEVERRNNLRAQTHAWIGQCGASWAREKGTASRQGIVLRIAHAHCQIRSAAEPEDELCFMEQWNGEEAEGKSNFPTG